MNILKIHLAALVLMIVLIFVFLGLSNNAPSSTIENSQEKSKITLTGKSPEYYKGETFSTGAAALKCSQYY